MSMPPSPTSVAQVVVPPKCYQVWCLLQACRCMPACKPLRKKKAWQVHSLGPSALYGKMGSSWVALFEHPRPHHPAALSLRGCRNRSAASS